LRGSTYIEAGRKVVGERERAQLKALLCVVEEKAEAAGRIKVEEKIVKSITEVMTRIDDKEGRNVGRGISEKTGRWGSTRAHDWEEGGHLMRPKTLSAQDLLACASLSTALLGIVSKRR
jgi:hypothetical protein